MSANANNPSKKPNPNDLSRTLNTSKPDLEASHLQTISQDTSFNNSAIHDNNKKNPNPVKGYYATKGYNPHKNSSISSTQPINNIHFNPTIDYAMNDQEGKFKKPAKKEIRPSTRSEIDPKFKVLGSEISKKMVDARNHDQETGPHIIEGEESLAFDETLPQRTACAHCLLKRRTVLVPKHKEGDADFLYCDEHAHKHKGKGMNRSKSPQSTTKREQLNKTPPKKAPTDLKNEAETQRKANYGEQQQSQELDEMRRLLEMTEKDLYDKTEEVKKIGVENNALNQAIEELEGEKDRLAVKLDTSNRAYKESIVIVESLLARIKRHLQKDLKLYEKIQYKGGSQLKGWDEVPEMGKECEELIRLIEGKAWETVSVKESEEFLAKLKEDNRMRRELIKLKIETSAKDDIISKLEAYIKEVEGQVNEILTDPKSVNKNNVLKVIELTKTLKENGIHQAQLNKDLQTTREEIEHLQAEHEKEINKFHLQAKTQEEELNRLKLELGVYRAEGSGSKFLVEEDVQEAIRQLSLIILSKEGHEISDHTRKILKDVFPDTFAKNITQWEQRVQELEEQNKRLLEHYEEELRKGRFYAGIAVEYGQKLMEINRAFEDNSSAQLPIGVRRVRDNLHNERQAVGQTAFDLEGVLRSYDEKLHLKGREFLALDGDNRDNYLPSKVPLYGNVEGNNNNQVHNNEKNKEDEAVVKLRKVTEENGELREKLESARIENSSLMIQLNQVRQKEETMSKTISKYEAIAKGISPVSEQKSTSKILKMVGGGGGKSAESSFSMLNDMVVMDTNWTKARIAENLDYLMMMQMQAAAIEEEIRRNERLNVMGKPQNIGKSGDMLLVDDDNLEKFSFVDRI